MRLNTLVGGTDVQSIYYNGARLVNIDIQKDIGVLINKTLKANMHVQQTI